MVPSSGPSTKSDVDEVLGRRVVRVDVNVKALVVVRKAMASVKREATMVGTQVECRGDEDKEDVRKRAANEN